MKVLDVEAATTSLQKLLRFAAVPGKRNALAEALDLSTVTAVSNLHVAASNLRLLRGSPGPFAMGVVSLGDGCAAFGHNAAHAELVREIICRAME
jgi:multidrug resistance protein MdtO